MTKVKKALAWIALGRPRSTMAADLGMTETECRYLLNNMLKAGYIQPLPLAYELTEKGQERSAYVPSSSAQARAYQRRLYRMNNPEDTEKMIARVLRNPINSVFAQGAQL